MATELHLKWQKAKWKWRKHWRAFHISHGPLHLSEIYFWKQILLNWLAIECNYKCIMCMVLVLYLYNLYNLWIGADSKQSNGTTAIASLVGENRTMGSVVLCWIWSLLLYKKDLTWKGPVRSICSTYSLITMLKNKNQGARAKGF